MYGLHPHDAIPWVYEDPEDRPILCALRVLVEHARAVRQDEGDDDATA